MTHAHMQHLHASTIGEHQSLSVLSRTHPLCRAGADGVSGWSADRQISVEGMTLLKSFTASRPGAGSHFDRAHPDTGNGSVLLSGYEGAFGNACLARSTDGGITWTTISSPVGDKIR